MSILKGGVAKEFIINNHIQGTKEKKPLASNYSLCDSQAPFLSSLRTRTHNK